MLAVLLPSLLAAAVASPRPRAPDASLTAVQLPDGPITCKKFGALTQECLGIPFGKVERWKPPLPPAPWTAPDPPSLGFLLDDDGGAASIAAARRSRRCCLLAVVCVVALSSALSWWSVSIITQQFGL